MNELPALDSTLVKSSADLFKSLYTSWIFLVPEKKILSVFTIYGHGGRPVQ